MVNVLLLLTLDRNPWCVDDDGTVSCKGFVVGQLPTPVSDLAGALPKKHRSRARVPPPSTQNVSTVHHVIEIQSGIDAKSVATVWPVVDSTRNWTQWSGPPRLRVVRTRVDNDDEHLLRLVVSEMQCPRPRGHEITTRDRFFFQFFFFLLRQNTSPRAPQTHIFLVPRTLDHPMHVHWLKGLTAQDELHLLVRVILKSHSTVSCPIAISWVCLPILFTFLLHWRRNLAQTVPIHGTVRGLAVWLNKARSHSSLRLIQPVSVQSCASPS